MNYLKSSLEYLKTTWVNKTSVLIVNPIPISLPHKILIGVHELGEIYYFIDLIIHKPNILILSLIFVEYQCPISFIVRVITL